MSRFDDEPLSTEERALADRLARLGPHDGPSATLDAKILAAAHAVAAPQRRRRWLGLTAVPGSFITGAGMAAALVLVIGTVWQLRPADPAPRPTSAEGEMGPVDAHIIERRQEVIAPAPPPVDAAAPVRPPTPSRAERGPVMAQRKMAPAQVTAPASQDAPVPAHSGPATVGPDESLALREAPGADSRAADPFTAPAAAPAPPPPAQMQAYSEAERSEAFELARARQQRSDEHALSQKRTLAAAAPAAPPATAAGAQEQTTLDRIEVTGSRVKDDSNLSSNVALADIPIEEDAALSEKAWLKRIRARRDAGDQQGAHDSLVRFRLDHPRSRIPRDLRTLLLPPAQ